MGIFNNDQRILLLNRTATHQYKDGRYGRDGKGVGGGETGDSDGERKNMP